MLPNKSQIANLKSEHLGCAHAAFSNPQSLIPNPSSSSRSVGCHWLCQCRENAGEFSTGKASGTLLRRAVKAQTPASSTAPPSAIRHSPSTIPNPSSSSRSAFTLIELLVTITIIGILSAMVLGALHAAGEAAHEYATKGTIAKLHNIIMERYESYMTRRVPINTAGFPPSVAAQYRLFAIRDLIRMEMPERWTDVVASASSTYTVPLAMPCMSFNWLPYSPTFYQPNDTLPDGSTDSKNWTVFLTATGPVLKVVKDLDRPALSNLYEQRHQQVRNHLITVKGMTSSDAEELISKNGGSECLYMIVALGSPEALEQFNSSEIGDVDGDTLPEFLDGWGRPISFLRWPAGFNNSDIQPNIPQDFWMIDTIVTPDNPRAIASSTDHDPFDTRKVDTVVVEKIDGTTYNLATGWRLVPLIYSVGPDGKDGLVSGEEYQYNGNPYCTLKNTKTSKLVGVGAPNDAPDEDGTHLDNITNHHIEMR